MVCSDQLIIALKKRGYNLVRTPKADIAPLQLFSSEGKILDWYGEFPSLFYTNPVIPLPTITLDIQGLTFTSDTHTGHHDAALSLSFLSSIFSGWGTHDPSLTVQYQAADTIGIVFHDIKEDKVEPALIDQYLSRARINRNALTGINHLMNDRMFVITRVIKSNRLTIEAKKANGESLALQTPDIQGIQGGIHVHRASSSSSHIMYEGSQPLAFGFQAIQLLYYEEQNKEYRYRLHKNVPAGQREMRGDQEPSTPTSDVDPYVLFDSDSTFTYIR